MLQEPLLCSCGWDLIASLDGMDTVFSSVTTLWLPATVGWNGIRTMAAAVLEKAAPPTQSKNNQYDFK